MCSSAPKVKPVPQAPQVGTEVIDDAAIAQRDREKARARLRAGRGSTILAGAMPPAGMTTGAAKTALGA